MTDQFAFLKVEWPKIHEAAAQAAPAANPDPRMARFHARRALELLVNWAFKFDASLRAPYDDNLNALIFTATQIEFVNLIVNHLTEQGVMSANLLYESPFTDLAPTGSDGLFDPAQVDQLLAVLREVEAAASGS